MSSAEEMFRQAVSAMRAGDVDGAERAFRQTLQLQPYHVGALNLITVLLTSQRRFEEAEHFVTLALKKDTTSDVTFYNYGLILKALRRPDEALEHFSQALKINPSIASTWNNRGTVFNDLKRYNDAVGDFDKAIELNPQYAEAFCNKGKSLTLLKRFEEASSAFERTLALKPELAEAWLGRGNVFCDRKQYDDALAAYDRALALKTELAEAWLGRGIAFQALRRFQEALAAFDRAATLKPDLANAWIGRAEVFSRLKRHDQAAEAYAQVLKIDPQRPFMKGTLLHQKMCSCAWQGIDDFIVEVEKDILSGKPSADPFGWQGLANSPLSLKRCAELFNVERYPPKNQSVPHRAQRTTKTIRVGYASGEFRDQATSHLIVGILEQHDRSRFEIFGFDNGWNDGSAIRRRVEASCLEIIDISRLSDEAATAVIRDSEIDILVNLNGYFGEERTGVFAQRPAPVQVNYLGFPGTLGASYMDYIIADQCVIPRGDEEFYDEKVIYLPECYQANDNRKEIAPRIFCRAECGLPERGFVYCCFNNSYKITPGVFDGWMRILKRVSDSVLWLIEDSASAVLNLKREAAMRGVDPERLVFAPRMPVSDHLARHRLAGLFLDTLPYNAHTTASDALWAGLPVLTQIGGTFPGRVAASLLQAVGLPELITTSIEDYEALAVKFAQEPPFLVATTAKLAHNRKGCSLFNTQLFTQCIEVAYEAMYARFRAGLPPSHIIVPNNF
jgi:predicted O-linked N-acetylglucosamine transferase (SPINDLY family)